MRAPRHVFFFVHSVDRFACPAREPNTTKCESEKLTTKLAAIAKSLQATLSRFGPVRITSVSQDVSTLAGTGSVDDLNEAMQTIQEEAGKSFDPALVDLFLDRVLTPRTAAALRRKTA